MDTKFPIKIVAFDMDETLGYFTQIGVFWDILKELNHKSKIKFENDEFIEFAKMMDIFADDILRPKLKDTFEIVQSAKQKYGDHIKSVLIYTNNNGPLEWVEYITKYLNQKFGTVVDQIVASKENEESKLAGGLIQEHNLRQSEDKSVDDLLRVCGIDLENKDEVYICFVDDLEHPKMKRNTVFYICIEQYVKILTPEYIVSKYFSTEKNPLSEKQMDRLDFSDEVTYSNEKCVSALGAHTSISKELNEQIRWFCMDLVLKPKHSGGTKKNRGNSSGRKTRRKNP